MVDDAAFERELTEMLTRHPATAPAALLERVARIPASVPLSQSWTLRLRLAGRLAGTVIASVIGVAVLALALGLRGAGPVTSQAGGTGASPVPSRSAVALCGQVLTVVRLGHSGSIVTFSDTVNGMVVHPTFPTGFKTSLASGSAELLAPDGTVVGREGQTLELGGESGEQTFYVCTVNGVSYP